MLRQIILGVMTERERADLGWVLPTTSTDFLCQILPSPSLFPLPSSLKIRKPSTSLPSLIPSLTQNQFRIPPSTWPLGGSAQDARHNMFM